MAAVRRWAHSWSGSCLTCCGAPCQAQSLWIPGEFIPGMELLSETLGDCVFTQQFYMF